MCFYYIFRNIFFNYATKKLVISLTEYILTCNGSVASKHKSRLQARPQQGTNLCVLTS